MPAHPTSQTTTCPPSTCEMYVWRDAGAHVQLLVGLVVLVLVILWWIMSETTINRLERRLKEEGRHE